MEILLLRVCDARFIMSSMGHEWERRSQEAVERARKSFPVILFACSGSARYRKALFLMQMAKTSAALKRL